jgi:ATP-dependent Lon protease
VTPEPAPAQPPAGPQERHFTIFYDDTGYSYESLLAPYLHGAQQIHIEDPYIRLSHQVQNFVRFCEAVVKHSAVTRIHLLTSFEDKTQRQDIQEKMKDLAQSLLELDVVLEVELNPKLHDREIRIDNGWVLKIGRGLDFYQRPTSRYEIGANDLSLRKCLETKVGIYRVNA